MITNHWPPLNFIIPAFNHYKSWFTSILPKYSEHRWKMTTFPIVRTCQRAEMDRRQAQEGSKAGALPAPWCVQRWCRSECTHPPHGFPEGGHGGGRWGSAWWPAPRRGPWQPERPPQSPHGWTWTTPSHSPEEYRETLYLCIFCLWYKKKLCFIYCAFFVDCCYRNFSWKQSHAQLVQLNLGMQIFLAKWQKKPTGKLRHS